MKLCRIINLVFSNSKANTVQSLFTLLKSRRNDHPMKGYYNTVQ